MSANIIQRLIEGDLPLDFNWNSDKNKGVANITKIPVEPSADQIKKIQLVSEDLRDGLHGIVEYPTLDLMIQYVDALYALGIREMTVGIYPGEKNKIDKSIKSLLALMDKKYSEVTPIVLCLATKESLKWLGECKSCNDKLNSIVFMGTAPSRLLVEEWSQEEVLKRLGNAVKTATRMGVTVIGATEHTTQTPPDFLKKIITTQVENGAKYFCIADTIGIARPIGTYRIIKFVRQTLDNIGARDVRIDWHGHDDLGNGVINSMVAICAGANRIHTVARGRGERAGNAMMEGTLLNLVSILNEHGIESPWKTQSISGLLELYDKVTNTPAPDHGALGNRSHTTSLGIHTSAMLKANTLAIEAKNMGKVRLATKLEAMARQIYTSVDPVQFGRSHQIKIGPWSGISTVKLVYQLMGKNPDTLDAEKIDRVLTIAKELGRELSKKEIRKTLIENGH